MAYERNKFRSGGGDRWRDRERGDFDRGRQSDDRGRYGDDDRGFIDRAGDEVRSWFGDEEAERRRDADQRRYERERGFSARNRDDDRWRGDYGRNTAGGWGNQRGWEDDRGSGSYRDYEDRGRGTPGAADTWEGSGFGGDVDRGRRFDRIDAGSVGTHGAHPMSAPAGTTYGGGYGIGAGGGYSSSAAAFAASRDRGHDPHYSEWRDRQISSLDRDYDEYRREHQSRFEQEFGNWREKRQGQRQSLGRVNEQMEVVGSDGQHVGKVDHVRGDRIILAKNDEAAGGRHHSIPCSWIDTVDTQVKINKTAEEAQRSWRDEERSRALFEREDQGSEGPHALNRSFSGTYSEDR